MQQEIQSESNSATGPGPDGVSTGTPLPTRDSAVVLGIPAERDQVVLVRSVASHVGARLGLSVAQITDLRLAVDEACGLFLLSPDFAGQLLECRFEQQPDALRITVSALVPPILAPDVDDIGWIMLASLVDEVSWEILGEVGTVTLLTRLGREI
jgi:serine/threonine-protein kinase RsbW